MYAEDCAILMVTFIGFGKVITEIVGAVEDVVKARTIANELDNAISVQDLAQKLTKFGLKVPNAIKENKLTDDIEKFNTHWVRTTLI